MTGPPPPRCAHCPVIMQVTRASEDGGENQVLTLTLNDAGTRLNCRWGGSMFIYTRCDCPPFLTPL